ncbi:hypothetical protein [Xanthomonas rydalmerensis]|uniref:Secreted protein n=1 Tax=Xanthomonas rydalmerensis TaxID=3046274 RepID=A0ABZ0JHF5_9XANT|nr:hypothetical protein [Xanthomonas sp. DM-2023]WOS39035.1 hypothetical protein QN243_11245 [Xanthomonas sp. DM-2023]WOS43217.1 hypothetical protein QN242_11245 [Xanthomonas sp. DM-2023]WOS47397.1 hypothetical protein QN240_11245 [Xanthomonas sp. DM-2023]WOS51578.1 hypothetical protein QN244_11245 [Xanthomonas sp. DM-2023]WOS55760.1 hypothetical protein QN245_11245 [Xanthomonas sp. DM-2023]
MRGHRANHASRAGSAERASRRACLGLLLALPALALAAPVTPAATAAAKPACTIPDAVDPEHYAGFCALPEPIRAFVARQDTCNHFAGEEPYDAARRRELEKAMARYCDGNAQTWAKLRAQYRQDPPRDAWLRRYGEDADLEQP